MIGIDQIDSVMENYTGKASHFNLALKGGHQMHLKHDNEKEAKKWAQSIDMLLNIYRGKSILDFESDRTYKDSKDAIDPRIKNLIMEELEQEHLDKIKSGLDYSKLLQAKGVKEYFDSLPADMQRNRFIIAKMTHSETKKANTKADTNIIEDLAGGLKFGVSSLINVGISGLNFILPGNLFWNKRFCVLATPKSWVVSVLIAEERRRVGWKDPEKYRLTELDGDGYYLLLQLR